MLVEHRAAFTALLWGGLTLLVFLAPLFIYSGEYSEASRKQGGADGGDFVSMIGQGVGLHIAIAFFFLVAFSIINIVFTAVPDMQPGTGIKNFYGGTDLNNFVKNWMVTPQVMSTNNAPLSEASKVSFIAARMLIGLVMTVVFVAIPLIILTLSIKISLQKPMDEVGDPLVRSVSRGVYFFIGATAMIMLHSLISSTLVKVAINDPSFSFFKAMQNIWKILLFGGL